MKLDFSYNMNIKSAYIIRVQDNDISESMAKRCMDSCVSLGMPAKYWNAFDGTGEGIMTPSNLSYTSWVNWMKVTDHYLTRGEVACALSHISLWAHCMELDQPIVILEHDAIMVQPYLRHEVFNSICYLGGTEQATQGWAVLPTPPHASEGPNYHFICRAHAYAIDPAVAKNMLAHVIKYGICAPLDIIIRADIFPIHQTKLYAYDMNDSRTTILSRPKEGRSTKRNDGLTV